MKKKDLSAISYIKKKIDFKAGKPNSACMIEAEYIARMCFCIAVHEYPIFDEAMLLYRSLLDELFDYTYFRHVERAQAISTLLGRFEERILNKDPFTNRVDARARVLLVFGLACGSQICFVQQSLDVVREANQLSDEEFDFLKMIYTFTDCAVEDDMDSNDYLWQAINDMEESQRLRAGELRSSFIRQVLEAINQIDFTVVKRQKINDLKSFMQLCLSPRVVTFDEYFLDESLPWDTIKRVSFVD
ncbi:MAG: hypothetical protein H6623_05345 [Bdellovibrionaceae bacterium]|nr:hypothetical protein [Pseudobdellovibrionaceae bacterium]